MEYAKQLYQTFAPGTLSWLDPSNNKAFLAGEISVTMNGISIYYTAKTSAEPTLKAILPDIQHAAFPIGPIGREVHAALMFPGAIYKYCKYPNAAKEYLRFMMEREQYEPWQRASIGYISHTLRAYDANPVWTEDPQHMFYRDIARGARHAGYAGKVGKESAGGAGRFHRGRHVRRGVHRATDAEGSGTAGREARAASLSGVGFTQSKREPGLAEKV